MNVVDNQVAIAYVRRGGGAAGAAAAHWGRGGEDSGSAGAELPRDELRQPGSHRACGGGGAAAR
eukprot:16610-Pyramimonas_sp.AAC.1